MKTKTSSKSAVNALPANEKSATKKSAAEVHELADEDMKEDGFDELDVQPVKTAAKKATVTKAAKAADDDDDLADEEDVSLDDEEDSGGDPDNDDEAYKTDKDFEEFDLPKSKTKSAGSGGTAKRSGGADDADDDFRDLGLDLGGGGGGRYADDDDDF